MAKAEAQTKADAAAAWANYRVFCTHVTTQWEEAHIGVDGQRVEIGLVRKPYPTDWEFLHEYQDAYQNNDLTIAEKSRGMIATTDPLLWGLWNSLRVAAGYGEDWRTAVVRQSQRDAETLIYRIAKVYDWLPDMLRLPLEIRNNDLLRVQNGGFIQALNSQGDAGRGEYWDEVVLDEGGYQTRLAENIAGFARARRIVIPSTPNGKGNEFYRLTHGEYPRAKIVRMHYSKHPDRKPGTLVGDAWREWKQGMMTAVKWRQEMEIDYDVFGEDGWFQADFNEASIQEFEWDGKTLVTRGWDFGYLHPACVWSFANDKRQWCRRRELLGHKETTEAFARRVLEFSDAWFPGATFRDAGDPAAMQRKSIKDQQGLNTDFDVLHKLGITLQFRQIQKHPTLRFRHDLVRRQMIIRPGDGEFGAMIHPDCNLLIEAFKGGYRMPDKATPKQIELETPNPTDDTYCHLVDADGYPVVQFSRPEIEQGYEDKSPKRKPSTRQRGAGRHILNRLAGKGAHAPIPIVGRG